MINQHQFERLLVALSADRAAAGEAYEHLRLRLVKFFAWEDCRHPEDCADEALNRVARRLGAGEDVHNLPAYAAGVARLVLKEALRAQNREHSTVAEIPVQPAPEPDEETARCLEECLNQLPKEGKQLILRYYEGDAAARIRNRQQMAGDLGVSLNSLRNRALRLRDKLEECMRSRLQRDTS